MKCPHCSVTVHSNPRKAPVIDARNSERRDVRWSTLSEACPHCHQAIIYLTIAPLGHNPQGQVVEGGQTGQFLSWPRGSSRPCPQEVPADLMKDFNEAVSVLPFSAQASAALTRRSLQHVLRDYGKTKSKDLFDQIQEIVDTNQLPAALTEQLDAVRAIGNFAAHPLKSQNTGAILPVEDHEAEWNIDVLEAVFDHYFVKPAQAAARKAALNKKLAEGGKPPIK